MKKVFLAAILFAFAQLAFAQVKFEALTFTPEFPKAGETVSFKYNKNLSPLIDEKKIDIIIYLLDGSEYKIREPKITQTGTVFSGSFKLEEKTKSFAFSFSADKEKEYQSQQRILCAGV
ncbi:hypothetical protein [Ferruginibacter sp.]